ncbi:MAG: hypothetical protein SOT07_03995, partial [Paludibacteraceae bacterium]|nr:hypothetical protein [Paludibacteraceae bacterium]
TDVTLTWQSAGTPVVHTYANVPVQRNYRTNILGAIFTNPVDVNIIVDESFDGDHNNELDENGFVSVMNIANTEELLSAIAHAVPGRMLTLKLAAGTYPAVLSITQSKMITLVPEVAGSTVVIAGIDGQANGNNSGTLVAEGITFDNSLQTTGWFTGTGQNIYPCVGVWGGNYTFSNCRFIVDGSAGKETGVMSWWLTEKTYMTFNACTFEGNASGTPAEARAMQIYDNVELVVDGCTFLTAKRYSLKYVGKNSKGVFKNNTISNASTCFVELGSATYPGANYSAQFYNNTLASGIAEYVVADATGLTAATLVTNKTELVSGTASGEPVALSENLSVIAANSVNGVTIGYGSNKASLLLNGGLLDGQGYTLTTSLANSTYDCAINCKGGTIKNLTIKGGFRGLFVNNPASDIVLDNVTFVNNCYAINVNEAAAVANTYELKVSNSTLDGWTSFAGKLKQATFTNCSFGRGKGGYTYADLVPYIPTVIENCAFCEGFNLWADEIEGYTGNGQTYSRSDIVLKNCTVGGVLVTADNVETLFGGSPQGVSVQND